MNASQHQPLPGLGTEEIREILIERIDRQKQAAGIAVGLIEPSGRRIIAHGKLAAGDSRTVEGATIFEIGSITKVFTSLLMADMVERKEVALDDPAANYLPRHVKMPERSGKPITLLDLATQTSGLPSVATNWTADYSVDDLYRFLSSYELTRDPGSAFEYSNLNAGLLGHLLAVRAGMDYESLIAARITGPLDMQDTGIALSSTMVARMATGHNADLAPAGSWHFPTIAGAGALRSSVDDLLTLLEAFLGYRETSLAPAMKSMLEVRRPAGPAKIGLAWFLHGESAWHEGGTEGFRSFIGFDPRARTGIVVLANAFTAAGVGDIAGHIWNRAVPLATPDARSGMALDAALLDRYTGHYQLPDRVLAIMRDGDRLFAQVTLLGGKPFAGPKFEMFAESETMFFVKMTGGRIGFELGADARITSLIMHRADRGAIPASRLE